jgi:putative hydrolase of the HAD superfamily
MNETATLQVPWDEIDTLLLDMDGTLLDLAFDNFFWLELVPARFAVREGLPLDAARAHVHGRYAEVVGTLPWYCVDHWSEQLGIDIKALKQEHRHLIGFLPTATAFLEAAKSRVERMILVTNAHRATFDVKASVTGIDRWLDEVVSSHDYGAPKEDARFWTALTAAHELTPSRCLLLDDSLAVLTAARAFGIGHLIAIRRPDSRRESRAVDEFPSVEHVGELI